MSEENSLKLNTIAITSTIPDSIHSLESATEKSSENSSNNEVTTEPRIKK